LDPYNNKTISNGNIFTNDSAGNSYLVFEKDPSLDPYMPGPGPRQVMLGTIPLGGMITNSYPIIDTSMDAHLDSPSLTIDKNGKFHAIYRHYYDASSMWKVEYKNSTNSGASWGANSIIWSGTTQPEKGYEYLFADSSGAINAVYNVGVTLQYTRSSDGALWSTAETVNSSGGSLPSGTNDITPNVVVTADGIMHIVWVRGNVTTGYGAVRHRMVDLL
jgi:hypothetical protein